MAKNPQQENRLSKVNHELFEMKYNKDIKKIELYLGTLITRCLEALAENDYNKYSIAEAVLNEAIVKLGSYISNFNEVYPNLKNRIAINFLKDLLEVEDIPTILNEVNPIEALIITPKEAKEIKEVHEFLNYSMAKRSLYNYIDSEDYYKVFENEAYTVLVNNYYCYIISKTGIEGTNLDSANYKFNYELDVIEGFVTNKPELITALTLSERILIAEKTSEYQEKYNELFLEGNYNYLDFEDLVFKAENDSFLVVIDSFQYVIVNKTTGKKFMLYLEGIRNDTAKTIEFLKEFSLYCLGLEDHVEESVPSHEEEVPVNDPTEENVESNVEENVPINEEEGVIINEEE